MSEEERPDTNEVKDESVAHGIPVHNRPDPVAEIETDKEETQPTTLEAPRPQETEPAAKLNPGMLVLQWLVYAFWGWSVLAISWLSGVVIYYFFQVDGWRNNFDDVIPYALASVIVLSIISLASDVFYSKHEPVHKTGATMVIMVIHAVIFALFGIGWLVAAVFGVVRLAIEGTSNADSNGALALILTGILVFVVYALTLLRTLRPQGRRSIVRGYWIAMGVVVVGLIIAAIVGPAAHARLIQMDKPIVNGLGEVSRAINDYTEKNDKLPTSLNDVKSSLRGDALDIVEDGKVKYTAKERLDQPVAPIAPAEDANGKSKAQTLLYRVDQGPVYHYVLCVEYATESDDVSIYTPAYSSTHYQTTPTTYNHPKGNVCYDLQTGYYYDY